MTFLNNLHAWYEQLNNATRKKKKSKILFLCYFHSKK